ncbi:MAG: transposon-encoded TnpW family protein [Clostridiales bacterium]|nr:transposon-encoded TnpW family protein [Clostridiales bacterium]
MNAISTNQAVQLAAPYPRKIGKVTFVVSSFGNPQAKSTAEDLLLGMLEAKVTKDSIGEEAQSA